MLPSLQSRLAQSCLTRQSPCRAVSSNIPYCQSLAGCKGANLFATLCNRYSRQRHRERTFQCLVMISASLLFATSLGEFSWTSAHNRPARVTTRLIFIDLDVSGHYQDYYGPCVALSSLATRIDNPQPVAVHRWRMGK